MAASQCTMSNFAFGNTTHQYCETISGGSGSGLVKARAGVTDAQPPEAGPAAVGPVR
jgi:N-methylhydantoinase B/oxoprolinase/acetone carboxylase alpha subunit